MGNKTSQFSKSAVGQMLLTSKEVRFINVRDSQNV